MADYKDIFEIGLKDKIFEIREIFSSRQGDDLLWSKDLERYYRVLKERRDVGDEGYQNLGGSSFLIELAEVDKDKRTVGLIDSFGKAQEIINKDIQVGDSVIIQKGYVKIQEPYEEGFDDLKNYDYLIFPAKNVIIQNIIRHKVIIARTNHDVSSIDFGREDKDYVISQLKVRIEDNPGNKYWTDILGTYYG